MIKRIVWVSSVTGLLLIGCGGPAKNPQKLRPGGVPAVLPGGKGTWVVNPVTPPQVSWTVMRGSAAAVAPVQSGDTIKVKCVVSCPGDQKYLTAWTMKGGVIHRVLVTDQLVNAGDTQTLTLQPGDEALRVIWARQVLSGPLDDFENLTQFSNARASQIAFSQSGPAVGELHWGPLLGSVAARPADARGFAAAP